MVRPTNCRYDNQAEVSTEMKIKNPSILTQRQMQKLSAYENFKSELLRNPISPDREVCLQIVSRMILDLGADLKRLEDGIQDNENRAKSIGKMFGNE